MMHEMTRSMPERYCSKCGKSEYKAKCFAASTDGYRCEDCPECWWEPRNMDPIYERGGN